MRKNCLWLPYHSKGKVPLCHRTQEKLHRQNHDLFLAAGNVKDTRVLTMSGGQTYSQAFRYYGNMVRFEYIYFIKHLHRGGNTICLCSFSCECFSALCFFFTLFLSLNYTNPASALFFSWASVYTACKENITTSCNNWNMEMKEEEGKERNKL